MAFVSCNPDENSNQSFLSDVVYQPKMDNSSSNSSSQHLSPPHPSSLRTDDAPPPMLGQESVDGTYARLINNIISVDYSVKS